MSEPVDPNQSLELALPDLFMSLFVVQPLTWSLPCPRWRGSDWSR